MLDDDWMWYGEDAEVLVDSRGMTPRQANLMAIEEIAKAHKFSLEDVLGPRKFKPLVEVRRKCSFLLREKGHTTTEIGRILRRDHSTICHSLAIMAQKQ